MATNDTVYSYHTFLFPFIWQNESHRKVSFSEFCRYFDNNSNTWKREQISRPDEVHIVSRDDYAAWQYFCPAIRDSIFDINHGNAEISNLRSSRKHNVESNILRIYSFCHDEIHNKAEYIIEKQGKGTYKLKINEIKLKIYNTGIAILILECENRGHQSFADVKNINDYGRRTLLPFISGAYSICADKIYLDCEALGCKGAEDNASLTNFIGFINDYNNIGENQCSSTGSHLLFILNYGMQNIQFSTNANQFGDSVYRITPALDDRMYVASIVVDTALTRRYMRKNEAGKFSFEENPSLSESVYEYVFVDPSGSCSCQDAKMRDDLFESHLYRRWFDCGTLYGASQRSFVAFMSEGPDFLVTSFLTEYVQIACLAVACYATLDRFEQEIAEISNLHSSRKRSLAALGIRERFLKYQSQFGSNNITFQEQGIETSALIRNALGIEQSEEALTKRLEALFSASDTRMTFGFNKVGWIIAILEIAAVGFAFLETCLTKTLEASDWKYHIITILITAGITVGSMLYFKIPNQKQLKE